VQPVGTLVRAALWGQNVKAPGSGLGVSNLRMADQGMERHCAPPVGWIHTGVVLLDIATGRYCLTSVIATVSKSVPSRFWKATAPLMRLLAAPEMAPTNSTRTEGAMSAVSVAPPKP